MSCLSWGSASLSGNTKQRHFSQCSVFPYLQSTLLTRMACKCSKNRGRACSGILLAWSNALRNASSVFMAVVLFAWLTLNATAYGAERSVGPAKASYPNIIVILADDFGYGDAQVYNPEGRIATPKIDELATQGMRFTDAHSGAAVCSPTRYGLLTGQHFLRQPWERIPQQLGASMIDEDRLTLPQMLQQRGYHTGAFGKWHLGQTFYRPNGSPAMMPGQGTDWTIPMSGGPNDRGFDTFFGVAFGQSHWLRAFISDRLVTEVPTKPRNRAPGYSPVLATPMVTRKALDYIDWNVKERVGQPFFVYLALPAIHTPLVPSPEFAGKSDIGPYGDFVMQVDGVVGAIVNRLSHHDIDHNTLLIFTSDNGSHGMASNNKTKHPFGSILTRFGHKMNGNWRGTKGQLWEGGHRVPFIARWPSVIKPGTVSDQLLTLEDLLATFAAVVEFELPRGSAEDSYNLLSYLNGSRASAPIRQYAVFSTFDGDPVVRRGKWVLSFQSGTGHDGKTKASNDLFPFLDTSDGVPTIDHYSFLRAFDSNPVVRPGEWLQNLLPESDQPPSTQLQANRSHGQLYNLADDPLQQKNVWAENPEIVRELTFFYAAHVARGSSFNIDR